MTRIKRAFLLLFFSSVAAGIAAGDSVPVTSFKLNEADRFFQLSAGTITSAFAYTTLFWLGLVFIACAITASLVSFYYKRLKKSEVQVRKNLEEKISTLELTLKEEDAYNVELTRKVDLYQKKITLKRVQQIKLEQKLNMLKEEFEELLQQRTAKLQKAKDEAEESNRLKTAFLSNLSHEIRTPMNAILGFINLLDDQNLDTNSREYYFNFIHQSGNTLLRLIDDIIDFSKLETGKQVLEIETCYLDEMLSGLMAELSSKAKREKPDISIILKRPEREIITQTDCKRLRHVLVHLLGNAFKFTEQGSISLTYEIIDKNIQLTIKDTGIGIEKKHLDKIFDRFFKIEDDNTKIYRGAGLGLALSKRIIELLGGTISVESKSGEGSVFCFTIPYRPMNIHQTSDTSKESENINWKGKRILIAEDEDTNFYFLEVVLKNTGAEIIRANDGVELLDIFNDSNFDMILLDIKMPSMDGYNALKIIRQHNREIPVIAQTAYTSEKDKRTCLEFGCNDYLSKPIKKEVLLKKMAHYLN